MPRPTPPTVARSAGARRTSILSMGSAFSTGLSSGSMPWSRPVLPGAGGCQESSLSRASAASWPSSDWPALWVRLCVNMPLRPTARAATATISSACWAMSFHFFSPMASSTPYSLRRCLTARLTRRTRTAAPATPISHIATAAVELMLSRGPVICRIALSLASRVNPSSAEPAIRSASSLNFPRSSASWRRKVACLTCTPPSAVELSPAKPPTDAYSMLAGLTRCSGSGSELGRGSRKMPATVNSAVALPSLAPRAMLSPVLRPFFRASRSSISSRCLSLSAAVRWAPDRSVKLPLRKSGSSAESRIPMVGVPSGPMYEVDESTPSVTSSAPALTTPRSNME